MRLILRIKSFAVPIYYCMQYGKPPIDDDLLSLPWKEEDSVILGGVSSNDWDDSDQSCSYTSLNEEWDC